MGNEGARTPGLHRVGPLYILHLVLLTLASQKTTVQQCMFPRGLCTQEPRTHTHRKSCLLLVHHTGLAGVHCTPAIAERARFRVNIG